ncbi:MAG: GDP-mannose 4,6-dehydratase [Candidatus Omnitrophica bacterium]|nr:GDP-mannose 4,6-dehydratase [Candidatus Omnitrophota bacterium]
MPDKKTYLITGATGFIGSCLLRRLVRDGEHVHIIIRKEASPWRIKDLLPKVTQHISDLSDTEELRNIFETVRPSVIYHLAAYGAYSHQNDADRIMRTNILGTWNMLKAASVVGYDLFVNTGSSSEYGFKKFPMKETDILEPVSYYAVAKSSQTLLCSHVAREGRMPIVTLRPFSVYGPYEEPSRFMPTLMKALYFTKKMELVSPEISRDLIYVEDMVDAYLLTDQLKKYPGEVFNIGTGRQCSIKDVVETAVKVTGRAADFRWGKMKPRAWDTANWVADISKAEKLLNWHPAVKLEEGLSLMWEWSKANLPEYDK